MQNLWRCRCLRVVDHKLAFDSGYRAPYDEGQMIWKTTVRDTLNYALAENTHFLSTLDPFAMSCCSFMKSSWLHFLHMGFIGVINLRKNLKITFLQHVIFKLLLASCQHPAGDYYSSKHRKCGLLFK